MKPTQTKKMNTKETRAMQNGGLASILGGGLLFAPSSTAAALRNFGVAAHVDAGKTTLTERMLFLAGATHKMGDVDAGNTTTDTDAAEREMGITINSAAVSCAWRDYRCNLIDTPGHADFTAEVERSLRVLDGAVVVFCAVGGVEPQTETVWRQADRYQVPRIVFVNKMDRLGADFDGVLTQMRDRLNAVPLPVLRPFGAESGFAGQIDVVGRRVVRYVPKPKGLGAELAFEALPDELVDAVEHWRAELVEAVAERDDAMAEAFLLGELVLDADLQAAIRRLTLAGSVVPVAAGSAMRCQGVHGLLDAVCAYLPSPADLVPIEAETPDGEATLVDPVADEPFCALVFKPQRDPKAGRLFFLRVYAGEARKGDTVYNAVTHRKVRLGRLLRVQADRHEDIDCVRAGDIVAVAGLKDTFTGDTLCALDAQVLLEPPSFPEPVISMAIEPEARSDQDRLKDGLRELAEDDPTLVVSTDAETGQTLVAGMGELHLKIVGRKLLDQFGVRARMGAPQVAYRESITREASAQFLLKKQTGGPGSYARVAVAVRPNPEGEGFTYANLVAGGAIPREFFSACEKGARAAMQRGVLGGHPVVDVHVDVLDGDAHSNDSSDVAFLAATNEAVRLAMREAEPVLLEPLMDVRVETPEEFQGGLLGELNSRRGTIREVAAGRLQASVPLAELFGFAGTVLSLSRGRAAFGMQATGFARVPQAVAAAVLKS